VSGSAAAGVALGWLAGRFTAAAVPGAVLIALAYATEVLLLAGSAAAVAAVAGIAAGLGGRALASRRLARQVGDG